MTTEAIKQTDCVEAATKILGDKWTPLLLFAIHHDRQLGFCQLQTETGGINPRTLSSRLTRLEDQGIIEKCTREASRENQGVSRRECYRLSEKGEALMPVLNQMASWGKRYGASDLSADTV